jgi:hypothetical protein
VYKPKPVEELFFPDLLFSKSVIDDSSDIA